MTLLTYPSNHDVFWVVFGWAVLYGSVRALLSDGSDKSTQTFDDSSWPLAIIFGWPALYWLMSHGVSALLIERGTRSSLAAMSLQTGRRFQGQWTHPAIAARFARHVFDLVRIHSLAASSGREALHPSRVTFTAYFEDNVELVRIFRSLDNKLARGPRFHSGNSVTLYGNRTIAI